MSAITMPPLPAVQPRPAASALAPHRWTLDEYRDLERAGFFNGLRTLLIDGVILTMPNPDPPHDTALTAAYEFIRTLCPAGHYVRNQQSFDVGTRTDPGPDLAVVPGSFRDYATLPPTAAVLIVEVAASSLLMDTTTKAELYATAGVPEYWVIDLEHRQLIAFRDPQPLPTGLGATAYKTHLTFAPTDRVSPLIAPVASVLVADLLP